MTTSVSRTAIPFAPARRATSPVLPESALARLRAAWEARLARRRQARAAAHFAGIDLHTLRDIGAPDAVIADAASRDRARERVLRDLNWG